MPLNLDFTKFKVPHKTYDNCTVVDVLSGAFPRYIQVRMPGDDGAIRTARWNGALNLANSDTVLCYEYPGNPVLHVADYGGGQAAGVDGVKVSKLYEPDISATVATADNNGDVTFTGNIIGSAGAYVSGDVFAFVVKNTSGGAAAANDVGYIDEAGEYKTTTTAQADVSWCVVIVGGANNADIYVATRGRVTVAYTGSAPSAGDFLVTSTTGGSAQAQTTMRPEIFAVCLGAGAGGTVSALLLCQRKSFPISSTSAIMFVNVADASDFVATISATGVSGDKVYYNAPSSGGVAAINPAATNDLAKITLHNTTQVDEAYIIDTGSDGGGNFIQVSASADVSAWVATDAITARSQTNTSTISSAYFFDMLFVSSEIPALTTAFIGVVSYRDTGAVDNRIFTHTFEANSNNKRQNVLCVSTNNNNNIPQTITLINSRFCLLWEASGAGTAIPLMRISAVTVAAP